MKIRRMLPFLILPAIGIGFLISALYTDVAAMTDNGDMNLRSFFFMMGGIFTGLPIALFVTIGVFLARKRKRVAYLLEKGVRGKAKILDINDTGVMINNQPQVRISLEIHLPGYEVYTLEKKMIISFSGLSRIQIGMEVDVAVDPLNYKNPKMVGLLWK